MSQPDANPFGFKLDHDEAGKQFLLYGAVKVHVKWGMTETDLRAKLAGKAADDVIAAAVAYVHDLRQDFVLVKEGAS